MNSTKSKRILLASLFHETHTFLSGSIPLEAFQIKRTPELWEMLGDASPIAGVLEVGQGYGWEIIPLIDMRTWAGPIVEDEVLEFWWKEFEAGALAEMEKGLDGVYLVLHGAMACQSYPDVEGEILRRVRALPGFGDILVFGSTDMHCNFSDEMATYSNLLITYRKNPHTDGKASAMDAAHLLERCLNNGEKPVTLWNRVPIIWPPTGQGTDDEPMRSITALAREIEAENPKILAINVHAGYAFADTPDTGLSFSACTIGNHDEARAQLQRLREFALERKEQGTVLDPSIESVMQQIKTMTEGPILLVEPSDNIGGGAGGDGTGILEALMRHDIQNAAVTIADPQAVAELSRLQIGERAKISIGPKAPSMSLGPVELEVELISTSDGGFDLEDANSHMASYSGLHCDMGPCAVVRYRGITILLTTHKTAPMDLGQLRSQGIIPEEKFVIGLKSGVSHRRAYDPVMKASFNVSTPGPCSSDIKTFPYKLLKRPAHPLDEI